MLKKFAILILAISIFIAPQSFSVIFSSPITSYNELKENVSFISKSIEVDNLTTAKNSKSASLESNDYLRFYGPNKDVHYRIFIDSGNDRSLPNYGEKYNDYILKAKRNVWHEHLIKGLSIDVTRYATSKNDFIKKYKALTFSYFYKYNFWNSQDGWTYKYGKSSPLIVGTETILLNSNNYEHLIFEATDPSHASNERALLKVAQRWNGNVLSYDFYLGVRCHWATGSVINHAAIATFKNDAYLFVSVPSTKQNRPIVIDEIESDSKFIINSYSTDVSFVEFDNKIKKKALEKPILNSDFKNVASMYQGYYGINQIGAETYIYSLMIRWNGLVNDDCALLLNSPHDIGRKIVSIFDGYELALTYQNSLGGTLKIKDNEIKSTMLGAEMQGHFYLPFIYSQ